MDAIVQDKPNLNVETVPVQEASTGLDAIASKMAAMKEQTLRNQMKATEQSGTGESKVATEETPVAPEDIVNDNDAELSEPEVAEPEAYDAEGHDEEETPDTEVEVSESDSSNAEIIDFLEFAEQHPNAKFKFKRNGKEIEIDAKKAASILGQGAAISEDARQLKIEKAEFDEYLQNKRAETEGLYLAMEFTVAPQLRKAYDEIIKTQGYQTTFQQQLANTQDPAVRARIQAGIEQNEKYIAQQAGLINQLKPNVDQFKEVRKKQVQEVIENTRKSFQDKELRNQYVFNEIREKVTKDWAGAKTQLVPGIDNIDLICSDEHILSLVRDGLKYRDRPKARAAGGSIAALTNRKGSASISPPKDQMSALQEKARAGDKKAQDNLLVAKLNALRGRR
jgi:ribosomal protein S16